MKRSAGPSFTYFLVVQALVLAAATLSPAIGDGLLFFAVGLNAHLWVALGVAVVRHRRRDARVDRFRRERRRERRRIDRMKAAYLLN